MRLGVHLSTAGHLKNAPLRGRAIGCQALQIFCGNPRGWAQKPLDPTEVAEFKSAVASARIDPVVVHATYLINLAAPDPDIHAKSKAAFVDELRRTAQLGAKLYVIHAGSHKGEGMEGGRQRVIEALKFAANEVDLAHGPEILLENTAGTANSLGATFEDLAALLNGAPSTGKYGICLDTCHSLAAGYEIRTPEGLVDTLQKIHSTIGMDRVRCLHINDSQGGLGSHLDRHEHIGIGEIGAEGFRTFFAARAFWNLPGILETPQDEPNDDRDDLWRAMEMAAFAGAVDEHILERMPTLELEPIGDLPEESKKTAKFSEPIKGRRKSTPAKKSAAKSKPPAKPKSSSKKKKPPAKSKPRKATRK